MAQARGRDAELAQDRGQTELSAQAARATRELTEADLTHVVGGSGDPIEGGRDEALKASPILF
jgi:hypothetical protein